MLDGIAREIVGVMPDALRFPRTAEVWVPLADLRKDQGVLRARKSSGFSVVGRLKAGVSLDAGEGRSEYDRRRTRTALSGFKRNASSPDGVVA